MKKSIIFFLAVFLILSCGPKKEEIERFFEDGVEIVVNHLEPSEIKEELEKLLARKGRSPENISMICTILRVFFSQECGWITTGISNTSGEKALLMSRQKPTTFTLSERRIAVIKS